MPYVLTTCALKALNTAMSADFNVLQKKKKKKKTVRFDDLEKDGQAMLRFREVKMNQERVMRIRCVEKYLKRLGLI